MRRLLILSFVLLIAACEKGPAEKAHDYFVTICKKDSAKAKDFHCECEAEVIDDALNDQEMVAFVNFLILHEQDKEKAAEQKETPEFKSAFSKIVEVSGTVRDKCATE